MSAPVKPWLAFACGVIVAGTIGGVYVYLRPPATMSAPSAPSGPVGAAATAPVPVPARTAVTIDALQIRNLDLRVAPVKHGEVGEEWRVVATVVPDESRISHVHTRVTGWIEKLYVPNTGETVRAGQPIAAIFSQELLASQLEYLSARQLSGPPSAVVESGRSRLKFFGMSEADIVAMEKADAPHRRVTLYAPYSGILVHRGIAVGTAVDPATEIATVLDLSRVWVFADVPGFAAGRVSKGMAAMLEFGADGNRRIPATVEFIDPLLTEASRTLRVRFSLPNRHGDLRPGMYGTAVFKAPVRHALMVPRDALVDTGAAQYVYVMRGAGRYEPRLVQIGARLKESVEVTGGLREGEQVVVAGVFLLDSESRLRASGNQGASHAGHGKGAEPAPREGGRHDGGTGHD